MEPITIIIPTINSAAFIQQTVRYYHSLVSGMAEVSVVIVDDHSTDATWDMMVEEKTILQSPIQFIQLQENHGQLVAYKAGESMAKTDLLIHCDDDVLLSREDLLAYVEEYRRAKPMLLYGLIEGKYTRPTGRSIFYWIVQNLLFYRLKDKSFSSLRIFNRKDMDVVYSRAWGYHGNLHTPWVFHPDELGQMSLTGSEVIPHPSRYTLGGYFTHQIFLFLILCRTFALAVLIAATIYAGMLGASHPFIIFILIIALATFIAASIFLKLKSALRFDISRQG